MTYFRANLQHGLSYLKGIALIEIAIGLAQRQFSDNYKSFPKNASANASFVWESSLLLTTVTIRFVHQVHYTL